MAIKVPYALCLKRLLEKKFLDRGNKNANINKESGSTRPGRNNLSALTLQEVDPALWIY
jgi:hypothetical protein